MTTRTERRCANPKCRAPIIRRKANAIYCSPRCSAAAAYARNQAKPDNPDEVWVCSGCLHPKDRQADPLPGAVRHPTVSKRPEFSGYCAGDICGCTTCNPDGPVSEPEPEPIEKDTVGTCPAPRLVPWLRGSHRRAVREGREACSCGGN